MFPWRSQALKNRLYLPLLLCILLATLVVIVWLFTRSWSGPSVANGKLAWTRDHPAYGLDDHIGRTSNKILLANRSEQPPSIRLVDAEIGAQVSIWQGRFAVAPRQRRSLGYILHEDGARLVIEAPGGDRQLVEEASPRILEGHFATVDESVIGIVGQKIVVIDPRSRRLSTHTASATVDARHLRPGSTVAYAGCGGAAQAAAGLVATDGVCRIHALGHVEQLITGGVYDFAVVNDDIVVSSPRGITRYSAGAQLWHVSLKEGGPLFLRASTALVAGYLNDKRLLLVLNVLSGSVVKEIPGAGRFDVDDHYVAYQSPDAWMYILDARRNTTTKVVRPRWWVSYDLVGTRRTDGVRLAGDLLLVASADKLDAVKWGRNSGPEIFSQRAGPELFSRQQW